MFVFNLQPLVLDAAGEEEEEEEEGLFQAEAVDEVDAEDEERGGGVEARARARGGRPLSRSSFALRALKKGCRVIGNEEVAMECAAARMRRWGGVDHDVDRVDP